MGWHVRKLKKAKGAYVDKPTRGVAITVPLEAVQEVATRVSLSDYLEALEAVGVLDNDDEGVLKSPP